MNSLTTTRLEAQRLKEIWLLFFMSGIALMILGVVSLSFSLTTTLATMMFFGLLLSAGAIFQIGSALWARQWRGFALHLLLGVVYLIVGIILLDQSPYFANGVTLLVAASLMVTGIFRITLAITSRVDHWTWVVLSGTVSLMLGVCIWRQWPISGMWVIGLFMGIEMANCGWDWVWLGLSARKTESATPRD